jgi:alkanesulfonate monooxygenase SsuD/methylene tetrahydromethanopterin reductase-like flavin-dependent oxidoreductase (luciferase family)
MTLYALTGGRFTAGVGAGSSEPEFDGAGIPFEDRFRVLRKNLSIIRRLLRGEQVGETHLRPWKDAIPGPPILIGAWGSGIWIKRAAREYDGWLGSGGGPGGASFGGLKEGIKRFRDEGGKRAIVASVGVNLNGTSRPLADDTGFSLRCGPEEARDRLGQVEALGFDDVLLRNDDLTEEDVHQVSEALRLKRRAG